ncbi:helix-turn-helix transcriptional regulator [Runella salmonicolor]|uniref:Helix-turn-helix domain-containing protein n=1 Tax=Runella salmonicolor TaxID=2950278 RepID=A0ABT1FIR7_9BACT|nr:helix-turn-helix domain-containing protein [Runella salmonicolor]MCP1381597.1 helix-turn-helix domain-containing protein [Runella salmonicolor]
MSIVSDNMKYLRKLHGMTQDQFARRLGIKRASVGAYEEQRANPNIDVLKLMSKLFNVSVDDLLKKDLRKIRETPNLLPIDKPAVSPLVSEPKVGVEPQTLSSIFEQYYTPPAAVPRPQSIPAPPSVPVASVIEPPKPVAPVQPPSPAYQPPAFNNQYDNSNGATMVQMPTAEYEKTSPQLIPYVRQSQWKEYIEKHNNSDFIKRLPVFQWPLLPNGAYRAFEAGDDFTYPNAFLIGQFIGNWYDIADGKTYLLVARNLGVVCRRVYNQVKIKGTLLLSSDKNTIPTFEVPLKDVLEVWEIKAFFSTVLPEPTVSLDHLRHLVNQMQEELNQIKK